MHTRDWYKAISSKTMLTDDEKAIIRAEWEELTGRTFGSSFNPSCKNCYNDAIILIHRKMNKAENGGYILKKGVAFRYKGKIYTDLNLTAEAAEGYIRQDLKHREDFIELARDYDSYEKRTTGAAKISDIE